MLSNQEELHGRTIFVAFHDMPHLGVCCMEFRGGSAEVLNEEGKRLFEIVINEGFVFDDAGETIEFEFEVAMGAMFASFSRVKVQDFLRGQSEIEKILMRAE